VVVFDEAQCLPAHILNPLLDVFRDLKANWGCSVVFSTATQPAFRYSAIGLTHGLRDGELTPIVTGDLRDQLFRDLQRVNYRNETAAPLDWDDLVKRLVESSALCVLNTRRQAREVWEKLRGAVTDKYGPEAAKAVRHLSSAMCAEHRMDVLGRKDDVRPGTVYQRLRDGQPCWVVSTQVIECGVDVSFPRAYRALGPLDSIVQVAGRCNREGELYPCRGEVVIFQPADNGLPPGLYKMATGEAATLLNEVTAEQLATDATVFARYFATLYNRADVDAADIQRMRESFEFDAVATAARVIDDGGRSVTVPYKVAARWVASIRRRGTYTRADLRRLQRYTVNLRPNDFAESQRIGLVVPLLDGQPEGPCVLANGAYDPNFGVTLNGLTPEQYLV
jgi:CRISPR-associated endonuclease/helicase Cas3